MGVSDTDDPIVSRSPFLNIYLALILSQIRQYLHGQFIIVGCTAWDGAHTPGIFISMI